jgi:uncharacterized protein YbgA (DUF1722 family)
MNICLKMKVIHGGFVNVELDSAQNSKMVQNISKIRRGSHAINFPLARV